MNTYEITWETPEPHRRSFEQAILAPDDGAAVVRALDGALLSDMPGGTLVSVFRRTLTEYNNVGEEVETGTTHIVVTDYLRNLYAGARSVWMDSTPPRRLVDAVAAMDRYHYRYYYAENRPPA